jgi:hypothetical protein
MGVQRKAKKSAPKTTAPPQSVIKARLKIFKKNVVTFTDYTAQQKTGHFLSAS